MGRVVATAAAAAGEVSAFEDLWEPVICGGIFRPAVSADEQSATIEGCDSRTTKQQTYPAQSGQNYQPRLWVNARLLMLS